MKIEKKAWPEFFEKVRLGEKKFDLRLADFPVKAGDTLVLKEWDPAKKVYSGRSIERKVGNIVNIPGNKIFKMYKQEDVEKYGFNIIEII